MIKESSQSEIIKPTYSDINYDTGYVINNEAIIKSLHNLLNTKKGEIINHRDYGTNLNQFLFDLSFTNTRFILVEIMKAISLFEPRVEVLNTTDVIIDSGSRSYKIILNIKLKNSNDTLTTEVYKKLIGE